MNGFKVGKRGSFLDKVFLDDKYEIGLLAHGDGIEILHNTILKDKLFYVYPADQKNVLEFYFILSGDVVCEMGDEKIALGTNDYFSVRGITEPIHFTALNDVSLLCVTTGPVFIELSEDVANFRDIVKQVEQKDRYTYNHSERVSTYATKIAKKLKVTNKEQFENIMNASVLHDIGKIYVPGEILNKPGRLTDEEFEIMKKHAVVGAEMIRGSYYDHLAPIIAQHHERLNGSGYPYGLKGDEILLEARIIAVSDTFDAMTEDRVYRNALDVQFAIDELKRLSGTHYDGEVVDAFEKVLKVEGRIR